MRLVLADEQHMFVDCLSYAFQASGHEVVASAETPEQLVSAVRRERPDVAVFGATFGGRRRLDVLDGLRAASPGTRTVVLTGNCDEALMEAHRDGSVDALVSKACGLSTIEETLRRAFEGERPVVGWSTKRTRRDVRQQHPGVALTPKENDVVRMLARGSGTTEMAKTMSISPNTLRTHVQHVMEKLGAHSRVEIVQVALERRLVSAESGI